MIMEQLTLFSMKELKRLFPEPELCRHIDGKSQEELKEQLEEVILRASNTPLLIGEEEILTPESRTGMMRYYASNKKRGISEFYVIYKENVIGAAYFWNGVNLTGDEYYPEIELCFIDSKYHELREQIERKIPAMLKLIWDDG